LNTKNLLHRNGDLHDPHDSEDDWEADNQSDMELDNGVKDSDTAEQGDLSVAPNVPTYIGSKQISQTIAEMVSMMISTMET